MKILVAGLSKGKGGIGTLLFNIAKCNKRKGGEIEFEFLVPEDADYLPFLESEGYPYHFCPRIRQMSRYRSFLKNLFTSRRYDFVWINNTGKSDIILPKIAKKYGKTKIIQHSHGTQMEALGIEKLIFKVLEKLNGKKYEKLVDVPLACSEASADYFYKNPERRKDCRVMPNGIFAEEFLFDGEKREKIRAELGIKEDCTLVGSVGRLTAVKNYHFILRLLKDLPESYRCILLGEGEERAFLEEKIAEYGLSDRVVLTGNKDNVNEYLFAMDVFLMPSLHEGMPFSLIEAQTTGLKCVVSDTVARETDLTGTATYLSLEDTEAWKKACLEEYIQPEERRNYYQKVKERGYDIEDSYEMFLSLIKSK